MAILDASAPVMVRGHANMFQIQKLARPVIAMTPSRWRHDS
jgi:hypothetical protein